MTNAVGLLVLLVGLGGVAATAALAALVLRPEGTTWFVLATWVLASAEILLLLQLLSLVHLVRGSVILLAEALLLAAAAWVWWRAGAPRPPRPSLGWLRGEWIVLALAAVVGVGLLYELFIVLTTPPNNWDSLAYHLPRAVEWFQRHAVTYIPDAPTERMNAFQPNAEILILYVFAVAHNDLLVELPQWLAGVAVLFAVYGIARRAGAERPAAAFAGLLTLTLTEFALESVTTQNDLVAAAFVAACAYFALGGRWADTALAGIALGAALGTKLTVALALPALVLIALVAGGWPRLLRLGLASAVAFLAIGFYGFGLNLAETGKLLGDAPEATALQPDRTFGGTVSTVARVGFDTIDLSGYRPERSRLEPIERFGKWTFDRLHIPVNPPESTLTSFQFSVNTLSEEDNSYLGPLGWLVLVPLCLAVLVLGALRRVRPIWVVLAASLPLYVLGVALAYRYNLWIGRFMLTAGALAMPLAALLYRWRLLAGVLAAVGAITLYLAHAHNDTKPAGRDQNTPVWDLTRAEAIAVRQGSMLKTLTTTDQVIPNKARILAVVGENDFVYALYGPRLERRVFTVHTQDVGWPRSQRLLRRADEVRADWILVNGTIPIGRSKDWETVSYFDDDGWTLVHRVAAGSER